MLESLEKLIPRFPDDSAVGPTVGPVAIPDPFDPVAFVEQLASYISGSLEAGWISVSMVERCDGILVEIRRSLELERKDHARQLLSELIRIAEEHQGSKFLASEAYALIKYNAEYLRYAIRREKR